VAANLVRVRGADTRSAVGLHTAARKQSQHGLGSMARKIEPVYGWDDIVVPVGTKRHLQGIASAVEHRHIVYGEWGFARRLSRGRGLNVLFSGPPGTGKTNGGRGPGE